MKRVFEAAECEEVRDSISLVQKYEKHEKQMKDCGVELKVSDLHMNEWISLASDTVKDRQGTALVPLQLTVFLIFDFSPLVPELFHDLPSK